MAAFVLIPGAGGDAQYWSRLVPRLREHGHETIPVDIPEDDPALGLPEYADIVVESAVDRSDVVLVAQSMGGFTAPVVSARIPAVRMIVLVNAMIPSPGETPGEWWGTTGAIEARIAADLAAGRSEAFDVETHFVHDLSEDVKAELYESRPREPADTPFGQPCDIVSWPALPTKIIVGRDDRFFPADFQIRVAKQRLGIEPDVIPGGHLLALANPTDLARHLLAYLDEF